EPPPDRVRILRSRPRKGPGMGTGPGKLRPGQTGQIPADRRRHRHASGNHLETHLIRRHQCLAPPAPNRGAEPADLSDCNVLPTRTLSWTLKAPTKLRA